MSDDYQDYYYFLVSVGRRANRWRRSSWGWCCALALPQRLLLVIDDSPTKRYGPKVEGADVHHNPTPGPADQPFLYGHVWVTISLALRHPRWGSLALPLRALLYVRQQTMATIPKVPSLAAILPPSCNWRPAWSSGIVPLFETSRKNRVARRGWRLHQTPVPAACSEDGRYDRRPAAQGRGAARRAAKAEARCAARA